MDTFVKLGPQLRLVWQGMPLAQRVTLFGVAAGAALLLGYVLYAGAQPDYQVLYAGLAPEEAGLITARLQAQGVRFQLAAGGTTVLVPAEQLHQVRVEFAADGLPAKGGKGFELFDQTAFGATPFTQHVNYLRALQGELAKTIMQIDPVAYARVHVVRPEPSPFVRDQKPTTASVVLKLRPGGSLNRGVANGIVALVARSVEGLAKENITLIDAHGRLLSQEHDPETGGMSSAIEHRRELEQYLSSRAENMLAQVLGPGRAVVRVSADLNMKRLLEKKVTYSPDGRAASSESVTTTRNESTSAAGKGGIPGVKSNIGKGGSSASGGNSTESEEKIQTEYLVSKTTQETEDKLGKVDRISIAVLLDLKPAGEEGGAPLLSLADAEDIIRKAVGFKAERGDEIKVTEVRLPGLLTSDLDAGQADVEWWHKALAVVRYGSLGIAALAALVLGWLTLRRVPLPGRTAALPAPSSDERVILERLSVSVQQDPQALTKLLTAWIDQEKEPAP